MADIKERSNAGTSTSSAFRNPRINSSPVRHRRIFMKETVPTALVSPQTIQVKVQPPMVPYQFRHRSPITSTPQRIYSNEFGSDLSFAQPSKLSAPNSSTSLHEDHAAISSSSNISMFSDNNLNYAGGESDDRLESLENRMRFLESRLHEYELVYGRNLRPQSAHSSCTNLMNGHNANLNCTTGSVSSINGSGRNQETEVLKDKIRKLQIELDSERRLKDKQMKENSKDLLWKVDENKTLRCRVRELESENHLWQDRFHSYNNLFYQPNAIEDLLKEKDAMHKTINELNAKLEQYEKANCNKKVETYPEDQFVPMEKYRALKAKSKKLLTEKCRHLRTEILEKESIKVQIQLQNAELSELRKAVYESDNLKCQCASVNSAKIREEILKAAQNSHFAASCLLGVCEDVVSKKTPDYDQILGLKSSTGVSISDQKWDHKILDNAQVYNEQLFSYIQHLNNDVIRMQRLMVDYYTNELVDTIDCRLQ